MSNAWFWITVLVVITLLQAVVFWPRVGILARMRNWGDMRERVLFEDSLKHLIECEHQNKRTTRESLAGALDYPSRHIHELIGRMRAAGLCNETAGNVLLTPDGRRWAIQVIRAHRLWERYLADEARLPISKVHNVAHRAEHNMTQEQVDALDAYLGHPATDPHGDPIPTTTGVVASQQDAVPLTDWPVDRKAMIVHIEDEPPVSFEQIMATPLRPGKIIRIIDSSPGRLTITDDQDEYPFAPVVATNIQVVAAPEAAALPPDLVRLSELKDSETAEIIMLDPECRGFTRRRLLDFGLTPATKIRADLCTVFGDPRAFRVRGTTIALRQEQAAQIWVRRIADREPAAA